MPTDNRNPEAPPGSLHPAGSAPAYPINCGHTVQEHTAFDHGLRDGEEGQADSANPYTDHSLREAWLIGHSVGVLNRQAESKAKNKAISLGIVPAQSDRVSGASPETLYDSTFVQDGIR